MVQLPMQKLRGALIGYGFIMEKGHAAGYQQRAAGAGGPEDVEILAIADISPTQRAVAQAAWPKARLYDDARALLAAEADKIDFVDIATPPSDHAEIALEALSLGNQHEASREIDVADGRRIVALRRVEGWPLAVAASSRVGEALDAWYGSLPLYFFVIFGPALAGAALAVIFVREFERRARTADAVLAALALLAALAGLFEAAAFLAEAAFASFFAATRARDAVAASEVFRFRLEGFATTFFIFARVVLRAVRALAADLLLPTRLRTPDEDVSLETRFDAGFALEAGRVFLVFDFVVFFDLLRAAIVKLSTRDRSRTR